MKEPIKFNTGCNDVPVEIGGVGEHRDVEEWAKVINRSRPLYYGDPEDVNIGDEKDCDSIMR